MPFTAWKHTERKDTEIEKSILYDFMSFGDSITVRNLLKPSLEPT
jgi:hypothetical protein